MDGLRGARMKTYRLNYGGYTRYCRRTSVSLKYDENGKLLNPLSLARSSLVGWGQWQSSKKITCSYGDLWSVSTAGHGGLILVTQKELPFEWSKTVDINYDFYVDGLNVKTYVYEFEEDCSWAVILYKDNVAFESYVKYWNSWREKSDEENRADLNKFIVDSLISWSPKILRDEHKNLALYDWKRRREDMIKTRDSEKSTCSKEYYNKQIKGAEQNIALLEVN